MNAKFQIKFRVPAHSAAQVSRGAAAFMAVAAISLLTLSPSARAACQDGCFNTATGSDALDSNSSGGANTATGYRALFSNTTGGGNTATGNLALTSNTSGGGNTAVGVDALYGNMIGNNSTAVGDLALFSSSGSSNIAVGYQAGYNLTKIGR